MKKIGLLIVFVSVLSCKDIINSVGSSSVEKLELDEFKAISVDNLYKLSVPEYMKEMNNLNEEASLQFANVFKETYTVVIHEDKQQFIDSFKEFGEYDDDKSIIENYRDGQLKMIKESGGITNVEKNETIKEINGVTARQVKIKGKTEGYDISYLLGFYESEKHVYMVMNWTLSERYAKYEGTFGMINGSFNLLK